MMIIIHGKVANELCKLPLYTNYINFVYSWKGKLFKIGLCIIRCLLWIFYVLIIGVGILRYTYGYALSISSGCFPFVYCPYFLHSRLALHLLLLRSILLSNNLLFLNFFFFFYFLYTYSCIYRYTCLLWLYVWFFFF